MTPERKQYLDSISKEERAIRNYLCFYKKMLRFYKFVDNKVEINKGKIAETKILIKELKKALPAPRKEYQNEYLDYSLCPICRWYANHERVYCPMCGQKLR